MKVLVALNIIVAVVVAGPLGSKGPQGRIIGGTMATPHQFPYQAGMILKMDRWESWCGGSLISPQWILTAAHCLQGIEGITLMLGTHNIYLHEPGRIEIDIPPSNFVIHEGWNPRKIENDIGLVKLPYPVQLTHTIQTIALPKRHFDPCAHGCRTATISGWGSTEYGDTSVLKFIELPIISNEKCKTYRLGDYVRDTNICVSGEGIRGTCHGDSGGPLIVNDNDTPVLVGITSFGGRTCVEGMPSVFTRVRKYLDWISCKTGLKLE